MITLSHTLIRDHRVVRNQYSRLLFTSEDPLFVNFARARTIDGYDITMLVPRVRMTSRINRGYATILSQKWPSLMTMAKWAFHDFFIGIVRLGNEIACKIYNDTFVTVINDTLVTCDVICQRFSLVTSSLMKIIGKSPNPWPKYHYLR